MAKCYIKACKQKAKQRLSKGNEGILCKEHWDEKVAHERELEELHHFISVGLDMGIKRSRVE